MPQNEDISNISQSLLYPISDPTTAFKNALRDIGVNLNRGNPFADALLKNAQGSRVAFLSDMSRNQTPTGYASDVQTNPLWSNPEQAYGNFLRQNLTSGNMLGAMRHYAENFGNSINAVKAFEDQQNAGVNAQSLNPYTSALRDIYRADDGMGALSAYASLRAPALGSIGSSWTRATQAAGDEAQRRFYQQGGINDDPFDWLFTTRGGRGAF